MVKRAVDEPRSFEPIGGGNDIRSPATLQAAGVILSPGERFQRSGLGACRRQAHLVMSSREPRGQRRTAVQLLPFVVEETLDGRESPLNEARIGFEVFGRCVAPVEQAALTRWFLASSA